jgi:hypothetical protein
MTASRGHQVSSPTTATAFTPLLTTRMASQCLPVAIRWDECVDEAYTIVPQEAKNPAFAPGFNVAQLRADLEQVQSQPAITRRAAV